MAGIDGFKFQVHLDSFDQFRLRVPGISWETPVNPETGEIAFNKQRTDKYGMHTYRTIEHRAEFKSLRLTVKETHRDCDGETHVSFILHGRGSLHLMRHGNNYCQFTFCDLICQLKEIEIGLMIDLKSAKLMNLEFGVNIETDVSVSSIIQSLLTFKKETFNKFKVRNFGRYCSKTEYEVKIYDKGMEYVLPYQLLRFEVKFTKMRKLNQLGIYSLADLQKKESVRSLITILTDTWQQVHMIDSSIEQTGLSKGDINLLKKCQEPGYWELLAQLRSDNCIKKQRDRLQHLSKLAGANIKTKIENSIRHTWHELFEDRLEIHPVASTEKVRNFHSDFLCTN